MSVGLQIYEDSLKVLNCKTTGSVYAILDGDNRLVELKTRPNICGVPYCEKCERERWGRLMKTYKPYFDAHDKEYIRHIIATVPVIKRSELDAALKVYLVNIKRFNEKIRKLIRYPFQAFILIEVHYQKNTDSYNLHCHFGVFSLINIRQFRKLWCDVHGNTKLVVKFPCYRGKPQYKTRKYAFLEYVCRRRVQQARAMPLEDYYRYCKKANLLRRVGFNKVYLAKVTTLRKEQDRLNGLPDDYKQYFAGNYNLTYDFTRIEAEFRRRYEEMLCNEGDISSPKKLVGRAFKDSIGVGKPQKPVIKQLVLNTCLSNKEPCPISLRIKK